MARKVSVILFLVNIFLSGGASECLLCESLLDENDHCTFVLDESIEIPSWSCPLSFPCGLIIAIDYTFLINYNAIKLQRVNKCFKFIIAMQNLTHYDTLFDGSEKFAPYSKVILLESGDDEPHQFTEAQTTYMYLNALHVLQVYQSPLEISIKNILTGEIAVGDRYNIPSIYQVLKPHHLHPLIDNEFSRNEINISLFHCPPFVLDNDPNGTNVTMDTRRFDGVEFRLLAHITKRWKRRYFVKDSSPDKDPWLDGLYDLVTQRSNVALCGIWLVSEVQELLEMSTPFGQQCLTFIVPRLQPVPRDRYIYLALNERVWYIYLILILFICFLVHFFITFNTNYSLASQFNLFTESVMEVLSIATQHGVTVFPRRYSAKVLLMAWFSFSLLMSAIYSTGYTTLLTTSLFVKPINTPEDVIAHKLYWGDRRDHLAMIMNSSGNPVFNELVKYRVDLHSEDIPKLMENHQYAYSIAVLPLHVVVGADIFENISSNYRVMGSCIYQFYTAFALENYSPYTLFFSKEIPKYLESGILLQWLKMYNIRYAKSYITSMFVKTKDAMRGPHTFTVANLTTGLYIWGIGLGLATVVFIAELLYHQWRTKALFGCMQD